MLRKTVLALAATATLGAAALAPNTASAWGAHWGGGHWGGWGGHGYFYHPHYRVYAGPAYPCFVKRWVYTPYGSVLRWVNRCY